MSDNENQQTVLGPDCKITGEMALDGDAVIMGQFDGTLRINGMLELTDSSTVTGTIITGALRLGGEAKVDIVAEHGVELLAGTDLSGRLYTSRLSVVDGASFEGEVVVGPKAMNAASEVIQRVESDRQGAAKRSRATRTAKPGRQRAESDADVETVPTSLDQILQQHRARSTAPTADAEPSNGS